MRKHTTSEQHLKELERGRKARCAYHAEYLAREADAIQLDRIAGDISDADADKAIEAIG